MRTICTSKSISSFSAGHTQLCDVEDKIYSRTEMRQMELDTSDYRFLDEPGEFYARLVLKAEAREGMLRAFFLFEDGRKIITPIFWWQKMQGLWDLPLRKPLLLRYTINAKGGIYLADAEEVQNTF